MMLSCTTCELNLDRDTIFITLAKFIEIGNIVNKPQKVQEQSRAQKREELEKQGLANNKRNRKMLDKVEEPEDTPITTRKVKHFSVVQNKSIYFPDIEKYKNRIMMNIETMVSYLRFVFIY